MADLFDVVVARKLSGGAGGGGGSSDFTMASVTITDETLIGALTAVILPCVYIGDELEEAVVRPFVPLDATSPYTAMTPLYKGNALLSSGFTTTEVKITVTSGDAEVESSTNESGTYENVIIHGDCEILFSDPE